MWVPARDQGAATHQTQLQARPACRPLSRLDEQDLGRKKETHRADGSHLRPLVLLSRTYLFACTSFLSVPCRAPLPGQALPLAPAGSAAPLHREDRGSGWHSWSHQETVYKLICWERGSKDGWTVRPPSQEECQEDELGQQEGQLALSRHRVGHLLRGTMNGRACPSTTTPSSGSWEHHPHPPGS